MHMETITTPHPLRTMTLRFDRSVHSPEFETLALQYYREIHDRVWEIKTRIQRARKLAPEFSLQIEEVEALFDIARSKFDHLKVMYDTNPLKRTVREQLKTLIMDINKRLDSFVAEMTDLAVEFLNYDEYLLEQEQWMEKTAFPQFSKVIQQYKQCSVDMVFFDHDLNDFRGTLSFVKKQEGKYYDQMNQLIEHYSDLNDELYNFFDEVETFDKTLHDDIDR